MVKLNFRTFKEEKITCYFLILIFPQVLLSLDSFIMADIHILGSCFSRVYILNVHVCFCSLHGPEIILKTATHIQKSKISNFFLLSSSNFSIQHSMLSIACNSEVLYSFFKKMGSMILNIIWSTWPTTRRYNVLINYFLSE